VRRAATGFKSGVLGGHQAEVGPLVAAVGGRAQAEVGRCHLQPRPGGVGWRLAGDEVAGRLECNPHRGGHRVVVDGRPLSWRELGEALESLEGWRFRLLIEDLAVDVRPDADVVELHRPGGDAAG